MPAIFITTVSAQGKNFPEEENSKLDIILTLNKIKALSWLSWLCLHLCRLKQKLWCKLISGPRHP